jgi:ABC-type dipeptide/oligopeptide/nickel transport system permease subunit
MDRKSIQFNMFHMDYEKVLELQKLKPEHFQLATKNEKESMVEKHKSISYWKDAWRRFKRNRVSMATLFIFIVLLLFAFLGPYLINYSYEEQYRNAVKLAPFQYSDQEKIAKALLKNTDCIFATNITPGSLTLLTSGRYWFRASGDIYSFNLDSDLRDSIIAFNKNGADKLLIYKESDYSNGSFSKSTPLEYEAGKAPGAVQLSMIKRIFPHVFGTDSSGRDLMARTMYGGRVSIIIGIVAALIVLIIGATYGAISGLCGGAVDFVLMRIVEIIYSVPDVLIVLLLGVVLKEPLQQWFDSSPSAFAAKLSDLGVGIVSIFITFALLYWVGMARIIRGQVLQLKEQEYVTAAKALGASNSRIIKRHLLPNCVGQLVIATCLQIPSAIFLESFLSFLGLGVSAPMASLGSLCSDAIDSITLYPYRMIFPAVILTVLVLSLNLVGDGLRDALDPRLKK